MKLNKLFLAGAMLIAGLASCNKDNNEVAKEATNATMSLTLSLPGKLRAADDDHSKIGEYAGNDKINTIDVYVADERRVEHKSFTTSSSTSLVEADKDTEKFFATGTTLNTAPFQVVAGDKTVFVVINATTAIKDALAQAKNLMTFVPLYKSAYDAVSFGALDGDKDVVVMSGMATQAIAKDITAAATLAATAGQNNKVAVSVKRAIARTVATISAAELQADKSVNVKAVVGTTEVALGKLTNLQWTAVQYEKTTYLGQKVENNVVISPLFATVSAPFTGLYDMTKAADYVELNGLSRDATPANNVNKIIALQSRFVAETTHADNAASYRKGNTSYISIKGVFTPDVSRVAPSETISSGTTFHLGMVDGLFYADLTNAKAKNGDKIKTYTNGKMYYILWLNPDDAQHPVISPVHRNQIYHANISKIRNIGFPKPDPEEPDEPLDDPKTYMDVEITVLNWGVHSYDIEL